MVNHPADEYRAELDFEITFTNGGSLRGREFRIDIDHPGMTEDELAAALIRDLGLLMVGRVDIHSRQVMRGPHRRAQPRPPVPEPAAPLEPLAPPPADGVPEDLHEVMRRYQESCAEVKLIVTAMRTGTGLTSAT